MDCSRAWSRSAIVYRLCGLGPIKATKAIDPVVLIVPCQTCCIHKQTLLFSTCPAKEHCAISTLKVRATSRRTEGVWYLVEGKSGREYIERTRPPRSEQLGGVIRHHSSPIGLAKVISSFLDEGARELPLRDRSLLTVGRRSTGPQLSSLYIIGGPHQLKNFVPKTTTCSPTLLPSTDDATHC